MWGRIRPGVVLGDTYRIVRRISEGGMGEVWEAQHLRLAGRYAVKVLHAGIRKHPEALARFKREAQITSGLRHPGIVQVIDFDTAPNGLPYLVMEYLEGMDLGQAIAQNGPLPLPRVVDLTGQIASVLTLAHKKGVVHRDLKPQNIFLLPPDGDQPERVKILDFGISKIRSLSKSKRITGTAVVLGTPQYMAPEQAEGRGADIDAAADQFSLAAIVYEMLTGQPPFTGDTLAAVVYQIVHGAPVPITSYRPGLPEQVHNVVATGLAKRREERFASATDFAGALKLSAHGVAEEMPSSEEARTVVSPPPFDSQRRTTEPTTTIGRHTGEMSRLRRAATSRWGLAAMGAVAGVGLGVMLLAAIRRPQPQRVVVQPRTGREPAGPMVQLLEVRVPPPAEPRAEQPRAEVTPRPRPPRAKKAPAPAPAETLADPFEADCSITVGSDPWAALWLDRRDTGRHTPVVRLPVACGDHQLEFKRPDLSIDRTVDITLTAGHEFKRRYQLVSR